MVLFLVNEIHHKEPLLNEDDISNIFNAILEANIEDQVIRDQHVQSLKGEVVPHNDSAIKDNKQDKCMVCNKPVSEKVKAYCLSNKKFNGKIYCFEHQNKN